MMLKCIHCDKEFKYGSERKRHEESHFPQFECKVCSKKFSFLSALRRHQKQHERQESVQCQECRRSFRDDTLLRRHVQYAHTGTYNCSECSSTFSSELALRTHSNIHKPESERRFRCKFEGCKKAFNFSHHLKHHELTHTNAKQHFCHVCRKGFIQYHHLKTHLKTHHSENKLVGSIPKQKFVTKNVFNKHMRLHNQTIDGNFTEIRFDSGISSDSSSANDTHERVDRGDHVLCATCGELIFKCASACKCQPKDNQLESILCENESKAASQDSSFGTYQETPKTDINEKRVNGFPEMYSHDNSELIDIVTRENGGNLADADNTPGTSACAGCACADDRSPPCSRKPDHASSQSIAINTRANKNMPKIEYTSDGIVKIKETFDVDIVVTIKEESSKERKRDGITGPNDVKHVPFNSCKAVLGNCIVSEDGSVGEGCLCARMIVDEQQMSAQEIDELTPRPNALWV